jgi:hypothetical protein
MSEQVRPGLVEKLMAQALARLAEREFGGSEAKLRTELQQGACDHCRQLSNLLAEQIAGLLVGVDAGIRAVYRYELESIKHGRSYNRLRHEVPGAGINLIVLVEKDNPALEGWVAEVEKGLLDQLRALGCTRGREDCFFIDMQIVEQRQADQYRGLGMLVHGPAVRTIPLWTGAGSQAPLPDSEASGEGWQERMLAAADLELLPEHSLFERASQILRLPESQREYLEPELREIKVSLIRKLVSDQLAYIDRAKEWLLFADLENIFRRRIGSGRVGGKAAGIVLAYRILQEVGDDELRTHVHIPESYFLGSDLIYIFMAMNGLTHWNTQKYKPEESIRADYPSIQAEFQKGNFPPEILNDLGGLLEQIGKRPIIVRSSSLLEDNFGTSFAGKYDSFFCPNQASPRENLKNLVAAIARTYASTLKPDALLYRRSKGLQDYDERMAILIQVVEGGRSGDFFFPFVSGVAFGRNLYRWAPQIRREDGFARLVWGLGTRAVDRVGNDYPHLVALSHPLLQPDDDPHSIRFYSQQYIDLIDLKQNAFRTLAIQDVLSPDYPDLRFLVQREEDGYFSTPHGRILQGDVPRLALTFNDLLARTQLPQLLGRVLHTLENRYHLPVDMEFAVSLEHPASSKTEVQLALLQCRPQSRMPGSGVASIPKDLPVEHIAFRTGFMVPQGTLVDIEHVLFVPPQAYHALPDANGRAALTRALSQLNKQLGEKKFVCVGPGRWGTTTPELGVFVTYADIHNAAALVELSGRNVGVAPEPSLGTHFFQDLMEAQIYPLSVNLDDGKTIFNHKFFYETPNLLRRLLPKAEAQVEACLRVIAVGDYLAGHHLDVVMDDEKSLVVAYFARH